MKKIIIFFIFIPLVYSELHSFMTAYTGINGKTTEGIPEISAVTTLDEKQIYYNDSNIKKLIPKQDWVKEFTSTYMWEEYIKIRDKLQQIYRNNIHVLMQRFSQSHGVHTYQWMYGCEWDEDTGDSHGFDQYGYDGEDFISLDLKENRYNTAVPQASPTVMKWNNDKTQLRFLKQYYDRVCVYWLKEFLYLSKATDPPQVSLLQKNLEDYVKCHVTGFLFRDTNISWRKNGQALSDSSNMTSGVTLPNEDGTFQRTVALYVHPDEWKKHRFTCVVEHTSLTETIQRSLTEDQIKRNRKKPESASDGQIMKKTYIASCIMYLVLVIIILVIVGLCVRCKLWKKLKVYNKKTVTYFRSKPSPEQAPSLDPLFSTPSNESSSTPETCIRESAAPHGSSRDEQNPCPEPSPSQFLTGGPIFPTQPDNRYLQIYTASVVGSARVYRRYEM